MGFTAKNFVPLGKVVIAVLLSMGAWAAQGQETADKIIVVVGRNRIILQSDLEIQYNQTKQQDPKYADKCMLLQSLVLQKMLMEQAERDSVLVNDEDVEGQLENRLRYFTQLYGSKEKLEQASGRSIYQMKEENRDIIKEQMIVEKMRGTILENIKTSPAEVDAFFNKIPKDSLPFFPATVEVGQIVVDPPVSTEMNDYARKRIEDIRKDIVEGGKSFETEATFFSEDPGSRDNGGRYDDVSRTGQFAPEFLAAAFKLQNGEVSPVIKTKFGYHIIQMVNRKGDVADLRHILIKPELTSADFNKSLATLDSIRNILVTGKMTFNEAVGKFSTDEAAKRTGGMIADPATGVSDLDMTKLDPGMVLMIDSMKQGDYSAPHIFLTDAHDKSCRIVYLRSRTAPHKANLKDDYSRLQELALFQKKNLKMEQWVKEKLPTFYLRIARNTKTANR